MCVWYICWGEDYAYIHTYKCLPVRGHLQVSFLRGYFHCLLNQGLSLGWNLPIKKDGCPESPKYLSESILPALDLPGHATAVIFLLEYWGWNANSCDFKVTNWAVSWTPPTTSAMRCAIGSERKERCLHWLSLSFAYISNMQEKKDL